MFVIMSECHSCGDLGYNAI